MRLCVSTDCKPVGRTIGPLQTAEPELYPRANFCLEKRTLIRIQTMCKLYSRGLYPQTNGETPPYVCKQSADCSVWDCTPSELHFGEPPPPKKKKKKKKKKTICKLHSLYLYPQANFYYHPNNLQTAQPGIVPPSELLSRTTHHHTYPNNSNSKAIRSSLHGDTLRRTFRSRGQKEIQDFPMEVTTHPKRGARCGGAARSARRRCRGQLPNLSRMLSIKLFLLPGTPHFGGVWPQHLWP